MQVSENNIYTGEFVRSTFHMKEDDIAKNSQLITMFHRISYKEHLKNLKSEEISPILFNTLYFHIHQKLISDMNYNFLLNLLSYILEYRNPGNLFTTELLSVVNIIDKMSNKTSLTDYIVKMKLQSQIRTAIHKL